MCFVTFHLCRTLSSYKIRSLLILTRLLNNKCITQTWCRIKPRAFRIVTPQSGNAKPPGICCHVSSNIIVSDPQTGDHRKLCSAAGSALLCSPPERGLTPGELQFFRFSLASWISLFIPPPLSLSLLAVQYTCRCLLCLFHAGDVLPPDSQHSSP